MWWRLGLPLLVVALVAAFWFSSLATHLAVRRAERLRAEMERERERFARERESIRVKAEQEKTRLLQRSHKEMTRESRRANSRANLKVGAAFAVAAGAGVVMMAVNFFTLGLLTLTGVGGALGGYLLNRYQVSNRAEGSPRITRHPLRGLLTGKSTVEESRDNWS